MNKIREIIAKLMTGKKKEIDLLDYESTGNTNVIKHRVRKELGRWKKLVVKGGYWMIETTGVGGLIVMALLVVVMSVLSYNWGTPNNVYECTERFGTELEWVD